VIDVWSFLQDEVHTFRFTVTTKRCNGYWLDLTLLLQLKDSNCDFWETLWKCAACDAIRQYFSDEAIMRTVDMTNLDTVVHQSPLGFFDPNHQLRREIRINRGMGVLLNGQVVHLTDLTSKGYAPAILPCSDEPYVAIEDSVILFLDFDRGDYHKENTGHLNPKLAKLMGVANSSVAPDDGDMDIIFESSHSSDYEEDDDDLGLLEENEEEYDEETATQTTTIDEDSEMKLLPLESGREIDFMLTKSLSPKRLKTGSIKLPQSSPGLKTKEQSHSHSQSVPTFASKNKKGAKAPSPSPESVATESVATERDSPGPTAKGTEPTAPSSNILEIGRYRSRRQLNAAAKADWDLTLSPEMLPSDVTAESQQQWTVKEGFEVIKFVLAQHEGLWDHVKEFHIENVQKSVLEQRRSERTRKLQQNEPDGVGGDAPRTDRAEKGTKTGPFAVDFEDLKSRSVFARPTTVRKSRMLRGSTVRARPLSMGRVSSIRTKFAPRASAVESAAAAFLNPLSSNEERRTSVPSLGAAGGPSFTSLSRGGQSGKSNSMAKSMTVRASNPFGRAVAPDSMELGVLSSGPRIIQAPRPKFLLQK